jgi:hypothetical protein
MNHMNIDENSDDDDEDAWEQATVPPPPDAHITMLALYDYAAEDKEELSFAAGDVVTELEPQDDQGWAKGMDTKGRIGFYPAHYVSDSAAAQESAS